MSKSEASLDAAELRRWALSRLNNEGDAPPMAHGRVAPNTTNTELMQLRIRVVALENLLIAVLAEGSERQLAVARDMAEYISPRVGFTHHPVTIEVVDHMTHFRTVRPS